jgi:hypothetical protein
MTVLPSFVGWGDSNMANSDQQSWWERGLAKRYPYMRLCSAGAALATGTDANVLAQIEGHRYAIMGMGTNNFSQAIGITLPLLQAAISAFRAQGVQKILVCTLPVSATSSNGYIDAAGQTPSVDEARRTALNDAIRAMASSPGGSNGDAVCDNATYHEVNSSNVFTVNGGRWGIKTAPGYPVAANLGDNVHYNDRGHSAVGVGAAAAIDRLVAGETGFLQQNPALGT